MTLAHPHNSHAVVAGVQKDSWEYADADTQQLTHNIHRYSGKFIPNIAGRAISLLTSKGDLVVDPFCGSGTTLVECGLLGRRAIGIDLSPLAVLISRTKITPISAGQLTGLREQFDRTLPVESENGLPFFSSTSRAVEQDPRYHDAWYRKWFKLPVLADLLAIDHSIRAVSEINLRNVARVAFSDILRRSSNAHSGYPNVMFDKNASNRARPIRPFLKALERVSTMVRQLDETNVKWADLTIIQGSAAMAPIDDSCADAVVSHPPYIASIPYAEYGALSLKWLGTEPLELDKKLTGGRRHSSDVVARFSDGFGRMLSETRRILKPGRQAFLMVGNPVVRGETIDLAEMTIDLATTAGLQLQVRAEREGTNRRANKMGAEHLLFFMRPSTTSRRKPLMPSSQVRASEHAIGKQDRVGRDSK